MKGPVPPGGGPPAVDHILLEVSELNASISFNRDLFKLRVKSNDGHFAMLAAGETTSALWDKRWDWEKPRTKDKHHGLGKYPHLKVADVTITVNRARVAGYKIVQEPRHYLWGRKGLSQTRMAIWGCLSIEKRVGKFSLTQTLSGSVDFDG